MVRITVDQEVGGSSPPSCTKFVRLQQARACSSRRACPAPSDNLGPEIPTNERSFVRRNDSRLLYLNAIRPSGSEATLAIVDYHAAMRLHPRQ
jgi:hypothetical protein